MPSTPTRVLVVEDDEATREALWIRITAWGYRVMTAPDAAGARRLLAEEDPDIVVADLRLPDASGLDLVGELAGARRSRPVLLVTAHGGPRLAVDALELGAAAVLTKPVDPVRLRAHLADAEATLTRGAVSSDLAAERPADVDRAARVQ